MIEDFLLDIMGGGGQEEVGKTLLKCWKKSLVHNQQKYFFRDESDIRTYSDEGKLKIEGKMVPEVHLDIRNERKAIEIVHICVNNRLLSSLKYIW